MNKDGRISYSAWKKYTTCPKLYDYHYNKRLRPTGKGSPLYFGVAIDAALNVMLLKSGDYLQTFRDFFKFEDLTDCVWSDKDWDADLFTDDQLDTLKDATMDKKIWACMRVKGRILLEAYEEQILPLIEEVHSVQLELPDRPGFSDAIVTIKGFGKVLIDNKTASRPYQRDAVTKDTQLALYAKSLGLSRAGFVVLNKRINKNKKKICTTCGFDGSYTRHKTCASEATGIRCHGTWEESVNPQAYIQLLIDDVPDINKILISESITDVEDAINKKVFPRNLNACDKMYGKPCPYYNMCYNNDDDGLTIEFKEKK